jgi:UDP-N-acetylglucosamine:LPS N-acetylglucosamine transferase
MDLAVLQKKAFYIPTPGQTEQIYLAKHLEKQKIASFALQNEFTIDLLTQVRH